MTDASVLVVGAGAIGGITAAKLAGDVRRVVVLDTNQEHVARLRDPGLTFEENGAEHTVVLEAVGSADELEGEFDLALIAVKSPFHQAALEPLVATGKVESFVSLGNGLIQDRMAEIVGQDRLLSCIVEWGGTNLGPGRVVRDTIAPMVVGELDGAERDRTRLLARCLEAVGDVRVTRNLRGQIWSKLLVNSAFTGLSAISGLRYGAVAEHPDGREAAYAIWTEGVAVGEAEGLTLETVYDNVEPRSLVNSAFTGLSAISGLRYGAVAEHPDGREAAYAIWTEGVAVGEAEGLTLETVYDNVEPRSLVDRDDAALARIMDVAGNTKPSMLQDLEQGRATEVDVVNGGVAGRGRAHSIPTPFNDRVVELVHAMEEGERSPSPEELTQLVGALR